MHKYHQVRSFKPDDSELKMAVATAGAFLFAGLVVGLIVMTVLLVTPTPEVLLAAN